MKENYGSGKYSNDTYGNYRHACSMQARRRYRRRMRRKYTWNHKRSR